ncbi:MAG: hypothetical protein Q9220_005178 [cf. Caloplaca sp. 1 TL-2023]
MQIKGADTISLIAQPALVNSNTLLSSPVKPLHSDMAPVTLQLRSETKPLEHRSALTPSVTRKLLEKGFKVNVERSPERIFDDEEFASIGATLVDEGSWPNAPEDHIVIGLKELEDKEPFPLKASLDDLKLRKKT